ncbi:MAG: hypothetical protein ACD_77C00438G0013 [uncultured bacterium]|nr:MAG: hypothetical protein ACD_77C00438G0013 [uncultured bacterium]HBY01797.1 hypothetical protein [Rikenellaceae bacterium]
MALDLVGKVIKKLPVQSGTSARGDWSKQEFIIETQENFPRKICMNVWGSEKVEELSKFKDGENLKISVNIESREFNNRWYTDIRAWKIDRLEDGGSNIQSVDPMNSPVDFPSGDAGEDDLPF